MVVREINGEPMRFSDQELGEALFTARTSAHLSRKAVEGMVEISSTGLFRYESGERTVPFDTLQDLAIAYGFASAEDFLNFASTLRVRLVPASA